MKLFFAASESDLSLVNKQVWFIFNVNVCVNSLYDTGCERVVCWSIYDPHWRSRAQH